MRVFPSFVFHFSQPLQEEPRTNPAAAEGLLNGTSRMTSPFFTYCGSLRTEDTDCGPDEVSVSAMVLPLSTRKPSPSAMSLASILRPSSRFMLLDRMKVPSYVPDGVLFPAFLSALADPDNKRFGCEIPFGCRGTRVAEAYFSSFKRIHAMVFRMHRQSSGKKSMERSRTIPDGGSSSGAG